MEELMRRVSAPKTAKAEHKWSLNNQGNFMEEVGIVRLYLLRAMYLLIAAGLIASIWPGIFANAGKMTDSHTVISAFLAALTLLSILGIRYPLKMLPILFFEVLWKAFWLLGFALPMHLSAGLDEYAQGIAFACAMGVVLTPLVIPWGYVFDNYLRAKGSVWR